MFPRIHSFLFCFIVLILAASVANADIVNGNVGNKGSKKYSLNSDIVGWANIVLTYNSGTADLDLRVSFVDSNGQEQDLAVSATDAKQLEKLVVSVSDATQFYLYVDSYSGSSQFRLAVTIEGSTSNNVRSGQIMLREVPMDAASIRHLEKVRTVERKFKSL